MVGSEREAGGWHSNVWRWEKVRFELTSVQFKRRKEERKDKGGEGGVTVKNA